MVLDKKKFENYHCDQYKSEDENPEDIRTMSVLELKKTIDHMLAHAKLNNLNPDDVPVFISSDSKKFCIGSYAISFGKTGTSLCLGTEIDGSYSERLYYVAPDSRPDEGEYWKSRGVSDYDVSGFVVSKPAGERLLRMVKLVLETDNPKSWLDYRESEPNWIQFKFQGCEFNLEKLEELTKNNNVITLETLKECKL